MCQQCIKCYFKVDSIQKLSFRMHHFKLNLSRICQAITVLGHDYRKKKKVINYIYCKKAEELFLIIYDGLYIPFFCCLFITLVLLLHGKCQRAINTFTVNYYIVMVSKISLMIVIFVRSFN